MANALIDPRFAPEFGRGLGPEGDFYGVGGGDGIGYLQTLMSLPGAEQFVRQSGSGIDAQTSIDPDALYAYLQANGLSINDAAMPGAQGQRFLTDASGQMVGDPQSYAYTDTLAEMSLPLLLAAGGQMAWGGGFGAPAAAGGSGYAGSLEAADAVYAGAGGFGGGGAGLGAAEGAAAVGGGGIAAGGGSGAGVITGGGGIGTGAGAANALYTPTGYAGAGMGAGGGTAAAGGAGGLLGGMGSANTWANLAQAGIGLAGQNAALNATENANAQSNDLLRYVYDTNRADKIGRAHV